eukprot:191307-Ditylum_brightwellii.AAC.1
MSSIDGVDPLDDLTKTMTDFLEQRMFSYAYENLQDRFRDRKAANRNPFFSNVQSIHQWHLIWKEDEVPGNLTIFAFPRSSVFYFSG